MKFFKNWVPAYAMVEVDDKLDEVRRQATDANITMNTQISTALKTALEAKHNPKLNELAERLTAVEAKLDTLLQILRHET